VTTEQHGRQFELRIDASWTFPAVDNGCGLDGAAVPILCLLEIAARLQDPSQALQAEEMGRVAGADRRKRKVNSFAGRPLRHLEFALRGARLRQTDQENCMTSVPLPEVVDMDPNGLLDTSGRPVWASLAEEEVGLVHQCLSLRHRIAGLALCSAPQPLQPFRRNPSFAIVRANSDAGFIGSHRFLRTAGSFEETPAVQPGLAFLPVIYEKRKRVRQFEMPGRDAH
jgi:hypothetical protein